MQKQSLIGFCGICPYYILELLREYGRCSVLYSFLWSPSRRSCERSVNVLAHQYSKPNMGCGCGPGSDLCYGPIRDSDQSVRSPYSAGTSSPNQYALGQSSSVLRQWYAVTSSRTINISVKDRMDKSYTCHPTDGSPENRRGGLVCEISEFRYVLISFLMSCLVT